MSADKARIADHQEVVEIDRLIKRLRPPTSVGGPAPFTGALPTWQLRGVPMPMHPAAVWACVALGVLLGIALPQWPYARACGWWLLLYLMAVGMVVVAGIWGARLTWQNSLGLAHIIALGTILWGFALTAQEILPRVGYAKASAVWLCRDAQSTARSWRPAPCGFRAELKSAKSPNPQISKSPNS